MGTLIEQSAIGLAKHHSTTRRRLRTGDEGWSYIEGDLLKPASRLRVDRGRLEAVTSRTEVVDLYSDFKPGNLRVSEEGRLYVIDPSGFTKWGFPHRDVTHYVNKMRENLRDDVWRSASDTATALAVEWAQLFLDAYSRASHLDLRSSDNQWLLLLYDAVRRGRVVNTKLHKGQVVGAFRDVVRLIQARALLAKRGDVFTRSLELIAAPPG